MSIVRVEKTEKYSVIANKPINDKSLSWGARGLLAYLLSKPNDWQVRMTDLENQSPAGNHATRTIVKELEKAGYMVRKRYQTKSGKFAWMVTVYEVAQKTIPQFSIDGKSTDGQSIDGKLPDIVIPDLKNTESFPNGKAAVAPPAPKKKLVVNQDHLKPSTPESIKVFQALTKVQRSKGRGEVKYFSNDEQKARLEEATGKLKQAGKFEDALLWALQNERTSRVAMVNALVTWAENLDKPKPEYKNGKPAEVPTEYTYLEAA